MPPVIRCGKEAGSSFYLVGYYFYTYYITLYGKGAVIYFPGVLTICVEYRRLYLPGFGQTVMSYRCICA